jgi:hypothetical protein
MGLVRADVSEKCVSFFRVEKVIELGTALAVTSRLNHTEKKHYTVANSASFC